MKVIILGAGIIGVTTAYALATRGYEVTVIDRGQSVAGETSFANGGQLSYSHAEPWANPAVLGKVFKWMFDDTAPLVMRPRLDYRMMRWGMQFLANCTQRKAEANTVTMLRLGLYSRKKLDQILQISGIDFDFRREGVLHVFTEQKNFDGAKRQSAFQEQFGCHEKEVSADECRRLEPALEHTGIDIIGGLHAHLDESGDARKFAQALAEICTTEYGVKFQMNTAIQNIRHKGKHIEAVMTDQGEFTADKYVMSMGSYSPVYLRKLGISVPIYPMKGYSLTFKANHYAPTMSITDQKAKVVYSRLGDRLRVAGTAEFAGYNDKLNPKRIAPIIKAVNGFFPKVIDSGEESIESEWACLRPSTPDGPPIIGKTPYDNLLLNTGHGTLGWTQAAGSAFLLADTLEGKPTEISLNGLDLQRY